MQLGWLALVAVAGCGGSERPRETPLWSDGKHLRDAEGRIALLRGINARVDGVFDVTFSDGRTALEELPPLVAADCRRMRELGLDLLRLPINWSGIEPELDRYDEAYLRRVDAAVACAADAEMFVMVDIHQDAYSKEFGEDGAPLWAIVPPPEMLLEGPLDDLAERRTSAQVLRAFDSFFADGDPHGLQAQFVEMLEHVAARYAEHPAVIGFEIFNEPLAPHALIDAFNAKAAAAIERGAPNKLAFFEPSSIRNLTDTVPVSRTAFPTDGAVYAPHIYTFVFSADRGPLERLQPSDLETSVVDARLEADGWRTPLVIGEFGIGPNDPNADLWMGVQSELHDRLLAGNAFWLWKEQSQGAWGVHSWDGGTWSERPQVVAWVSRIHAVRIAGGDVDNHWDRTTGALTLAATGGEVPHLIYVPERFASTFQISCDGVSLPTSRDMLGLVEARCDGVLSVVP